ncbi:SIR2 family protein [Nitrincola alkalisediminis]|uniref:SIR2 family protein n=1 Tax=Nitrincola alkalisediminis TaxID=1366656 RepID=UPI001873C2DA|nr:SIR2 family protein [Nitrincola alkalisediminis]
MMNKRLPESLLEAMHSGQCVPVIGSDALNDVVDAEGQPIPAGSDSLIIAMNQGRPMAPKLMYEFPRAAMNIELKKGRKAVTRFLDKIYRDTTWSVSNAHQTLAALNLDYIIDMNRDTQMQTLWQDTPHILVVGVARIGGGTERYRLFYYNGNQYLATLASWLDTDLPILFKPVGTPLPESLYIASDADYVDYLTELMGGFGMPPFLKQKRIGKQYLLLGLRLNRDTPRMLLNDITYGAGMPAGWACLPNPTPNEEKFLSRKGFQILPMTHEECLAALLETTHPCYA